MKKHILVLGAGVSGLSTGLLLLDNDFDVTIWAKDFPPDTTSNKAGAFWYPYLCYPQDKVTVWAKKSLDYFNSSGILDDPNSGCIRRSITEYRDKQSTDPWWKNANNSFRRPDNSSLPKGYVDGYQVDGPLIDTSIYLNYLINLFKQNGGSLVKKEVHSISEVQDNNQIVINCTGLGSYTLFNDKRLYPVRGQTVRIKANGYDKIVFDDEGPNKVAVIVPRMHDIILGTTLQIDDWNTEISTEDTNDILRRCAKLDPAFASVDIIGESVGLRPARDVVRLEAENYGSNTVIHNYGHGGSGFTLSWGCAQDVVDLVKHYIG